MAAPNIFNATIATGNTALLAVTTVATAIVSNAAASNRVLKINSLIISNIDGTNPADVTVDVFRSSTAFRIASTITVPADATLVAITKENQIYLEEGDSLRCTASANSALHAVCSFESLS